MKVELSAVGFYPNGIPKLEEPDRMVFSDSEMFLDKILLTFKGEEYLIDKKELTRLVKSL